MNPLRNTYAPITHPAYTIKAARYAKGKVAIRCLDGIDGFKGRANRLLDAIAPSARYSCREHAAICSPAQAEKFQQAYARGADADLGIRNGVLRYSTVSDPMVVDA